MSSVLATVDVIEDLAQPKVSNFRDAGGLSLGTSRMVSGRLYRSAAPGRLEPDCAAALRSLGVATIVDLRGLGEAGSAPTVAPDPDHFNIVQTPIEPRTSAVVREALANGSASAPMMRDLMVQSYRAYVTEASYSFGDALTTLFTSETPALVHCTAGKDRTGFIVAVIQSALGASEDAIRDDYLRTNADWDRASVAAHLPLGSEAIAPILVADYDYLTAAFEEIERQDGTVVAFIRRATRGRIDTAHLDAFIDKGHHA